MEPSRPRPRAGRRAPSRAVRSRATARRRTRAGALLRPPPRRAPLPARRALPGRRAAPRLVRAEREGDEGEEAEGARSGPRTKSRPDRASRQKSRSRPSATPPYAIAELRAMFPSGKTRAASPTASPIRGFSQAPRPAATTMAATRKARTEGASRPDRPRLIASATGAARRTSRGAVRASPTAAVEARSPRGAEPPGGTDSRSAARADARGRLAESRASAPSTAASSLLGRSRRSDPSGARPPRSRATSWSGTPRTDGAQTGLLQSTTPTAQTSLARRVLAGEALGGDVGERSGTSPTAVSVSAPSNWASPKSRRRARARRCPRAGRSTASRHGARSRPGGRARGRRAPARRARRPPRPRGPPCAAPRAACGPARTRTRCRRGPVVAHVVGADTAVVTQPPAASASRSARAAAFPSRGMIFSATSSPLRSSSASQTEPDPPPRGAKRPVAAEDELRGGGECDGGHRYRPSWPWRRELLRGPFPRLCALCLV